MSDKGRGRACVWGKGSEGRRKGLVWFESLEGEGGGGLRGRRRERDREREYRTGAGMVKRGLRNSGE